MIENAGSNAGNISCCCAIGWLSFPVVSVDISVEAWCTWLEGVRLQDGLEGIRFLCREGLRKAGIAK